MKTMRGEWCDQCRKPGPFKIRYARDGHERRVFCTARCLRLYLIEDTPYQRGLDFKTRTGLTAAYCVEVSMLSAGAVAILTRGPSPLAASFEASARDAGSIHVDGPLSSNYLVHGTDLDGKTPQQIANHIRRCEEADRRAQWPSTSTRS